MEKQINAQCQHPASHWPPSNDELEKLSHPSAVDGYYEFALRREAWPAKTLGGPKVLLLLLPRNPMRGTLVVAEFRGNFSCNVTCDYSMISAVAAAIPRAEVFLRNLREKKSPADHNHERPPLPDRCEWVDGVFGVSVRDDLFTTLYTLPTSERQASILDALAKEFRRAHRR